MPASLLYLRVPFLAMAKQKHYCALRMVQEYNQPK